MKKLKFTWLILSAILLFGSSTLKSQSFDWNTGGNTLIGTGILGNSENFDILFRTDGVNRMQLMESGTTTIDGYSIDYDGHLGLSLTPAFFGTGSGSANPFSVLHLNGTGNNASGPQQFGYRDWMRPGITFTHNSDLMYVGPKVGPGGQDVTDAVIAWADNPGSGGVGPDVLRFLFTGIGMGSTTVSTDFQTASDYDGREIARMHGDGRMGVGLNWNNTNQPKRTLDVMNDQDEPQLRLSHDIASTLTGGDHADFQVSDDGDLYIKPQSGDVKAVAIGFLEGEESAPAAPLGVQTILDVGGLTRIRNLPSAGDNDCLVLGNQVSGNADNYLKRLDFTGDVNEYLSGNGTWETMTANDCRWLDVPSTTVMGETDIFTGFPQGDNCDRGKVGIGVEEVRRAKLEVENVITRDEVDWAIYGGVDLDNTSPSVAPRIIAGVYGEVHNGNAPTTTNAGVYGISTRGRYQVGVFGESVGIEGITGNSMGVAGYASGPADGFRIGVYGEATAGGDAGYFVGGISTTSGALIISDESVKTNVLEIENAIDIINSLSPKTYDYISPENRDIPFDEGTRYGFIAQEVQTVLPTLVEQTRVPEARDSSGAFIEGTSVELLGMKYTELIPILVAAVKEQNTALNSQVQENQVLSNEVLELTEKLQEQEATIAALEAQMNDVLSSVQLMQSNVNNCCGTAPVEKGHTETGKLELDQNFPNPFETETTINFTIYEPAQIRLEISDAQGRVLDVLVNGRLSEGRYTERWDASAYAPGTYFYSLYADTELLTKKMIRK